MRLTIMGPAGAGKGTLGYRVREVFQVAHVATGNMFRHEISNKTELGLIAQSYIEVGKLVPDNVTIAMVMKRLEEEDCRTGFLLDGFPRTIAQAKYLQESLATRNQEIQRVLNLRVNDAILTQRIIGRRICPKCEAIYNVTSNPPLKEGICDRCQSSLIARKDDTEEQLSIRLKEYFASTEPVLDYYRSLEIVVDLDGMAPALEVWDEALPFLEELL